MVRMLVQIPITVSTRVCYLVEERMNSQTTAVLNVDSPDHCKQEVVVVVFDVKVFLVPMDLVATHLVNE